jgi:hypothetical protein
MKGPARILSCIAFVLLPIGQTAFGQGLLADGFDTSKTVTLKGTMRGAWVVPGQVPAIIMLEVVDAAGQKEMWLVAGKPAAVQQREGLFIIGPTAPVKSGDAITVAAYLQKPGSKAQPTLAAALQGGPMKPGFVDELAQDKARLAHGIEITTPDCKKLAFGER